MPATTLSCLPFDVLAEIFELLSPRDILSVGQTCRYLFECVAERSVWIKLYSRIPIPFPSASTPSAPIEDIRRQVIREAAINSQWHKKLQTQKSFTKEYRHQSIAAAELLPGGDFLLIIHKDGAVGLRKLGSNFGDGVDQRTQLQPSELCPFTLRNMELWSYAVLPSSSTDGEVIIEYSETVTDHHAHTRIFTYHLSLDGCAELYQSAHLLDNFVRQIHSYSRFGSTFAALYTPTIMDNLYLAVFQIPSTQEPVPLEEALFKFANVDAPIINQASAALVMASARRVVLAAYGCIFVYDLPSDLHFSPDAEKTSPISLSPVWKWSENVSIPKDFPSHYRGNIFYDNNLLDPMMFFYIPGHALHFLRLRAIPSDNGDLIHDHKVWNLDFGTTLSRLYIGNKRAFWYTQGEDNDVLNISTVTFQDVIEQGSFDVELEHGMTVHTENASFDESSGRISFVAREDSGDLVVLVMDVLHN